MFISSPLLAYNRYMSVTLKSGKSWSGYAEFQNVDRILFVESPQEQIPDNAFRLNVISDKVELLGWENESKFYIDTSNVRTIYLNKDSSYMFDNFPNLKIVQFNNKVNFSKVRNISHIFENKKNLIFSYPIDISNCTDMSYALSHYEGSTLSLFSGSSEKVQNFEGCFSGAVLSIYDMLAWLQLKSATNLKDMFSESIIPGAGSRVNTLFQNIKLDNVLSVSSLFCRCQGLDIIDAKFEFGQTQVDMSRMFEDCDGISGKVTIKLKNNAVSELNLNSMFKNCSLVTIIDIQGQFKCLDLSQFAYNATNLLQVNLAGLTMDEEVQVKNYFYENNSLYRITVSKDFMEYCWIYDDNGTKINIGSLTGTLIKDNGVYRSYGIWFDDDGKPYKTNESFEGTVPDIISLNSCWSYAVTTKQNQNVVYINCSQGRYDAKYLNRDTDTLVLGENTNCLTVSPNRLKLLYDN